MSTTNENERIFNESVLMPKSSSNNEPENNINSDQVYSIDGIRLCLIINQYKFKNHKTREGSQYDVNRLLKLFEESLNFETQLLCNATGSEITEKLLKIQERCLNEKIAMLVVIAMSHGQLETINTADDQSYEIDRLIYLFRGTVMEGKPKFFIIQACSGTTYQQGVVSADVKIVKRFDWNKLPVDADTLIAYSSVHGYASFRHNQYGSIFIYFLYKIFMSNLKNKVDVVSLLTMVNRLTADKVVGLENDLMKKDIYKQMPSFRSTFTKKLYLSSIMESTVGRKEKKRLSQFQKFFKINENEFLDCELSYRDLMNKENRKYGFCVIFSQGKPPKDTSLKARLGADKDGDEIQKLFRDTLKLDYVRLHEDLARNEIIDKLNKIVEWKDGLKRIHSFFVIMLTYGENGTVENKSLSIWANDGRMSIDDLISPFKGDKCPELVNIPKVFFIQACEGDKQGPNVNFSLLQEKSSNGTFINQFNNKTVPIEADILLTYSTIPAFDDNGSLYVRHFCETITNGYKAMDLLSLLTMVNRKVTEDIMCKQEEVKENEKQMPCFVSQLTKKYYFTNAIETMNNDKDDKPLPYSEEKESSFCIIFDQTQSSTNKHCRKLNNDADVLEKIFYEKFKFKVFIHENLTKKEIHDVLDEVKSKSEFGRVICLVVIMLSHIEDDKRVWANDEPFDVSLLTIPFREQNCPELKGKKKIFIIQGCLKDWANHGIKWNDLHDPALTNENMLTVYSIKNGHCVDNGVDNSEFVERFYKRTDEIETFDVETIVNCVEDQIEKRKQNSLQKTHKINRFGKRSAI